MNESLTRFLGALSRFFERLGAWVAGFTFWRFVVFSLLVLIASSIVGDLFSSAYRRSDATDKTAIQPHGKAVSPQPATPGSPPKTADVAILDGKTKKRCLSEMSVGWSGVHVKKDCRGAPANTAASEPSDTADDADSEVVASSEHESVDLADVALAVLAVLWVLWFVGRARRKAEARADRAEAVAEKEGLERQVAEARLQALQAQVEPHFLFNTLAAVEHLIETDPPRAATMQRHLIAFLRGAMPRMRGEAVTLGDEVELCRNYLAIMKIRMEDRLDFSIDLPPELAGASFPPLMLQSVAENAVKHGLEPKATGGSILISARAAAGRLRVAVADSGLGFGVADTTGTGIGLNNIRERLAGLFGDKAALVISPNAPTGAQVAIEIPYDPGNGSHR
jgi:hypothetical protein